jgi:AcrR family transcriptional regulator
MAAMITAVAEKGHAGVTVGDVVRRSGVSRKTFYDLFESKDECFLAACDELLARLLQRIAEAYAAADYWGAKALAALGTILEFAASDPEVARVGLIEMPSAGAEAVERYRRMMRSLATLLEEAMGDSPFPPPLTQQAMLVAITGIAGIATELVRDGRTKELPQLRDDAALIGLSIFIGPKQAQRVVDRAVAELEDREAAASGGAFGTSSDAVDRAMESGDSERGGRLAEPPPPLPRGPQGLSRQFVASNQRQRLYAALIAAVAEKGYQATTIEDVTTRSRVSRKSFYEMFRNKEECFLAAYDELLALLVTRVDEAYRAAEGWQAKVVAATGALLEFFAAEPEVAQVGMIEVMAAGPRALERYRLAQGAFAVYLRDAAEQASYPRERFEQASMAAIGGMTTLIAETVRRGRTRELPAMRDDLAGFGLAILTGADAAEEAVREARAELDGGAAGSGT